MTNQDEALDTLLAECPLIGAWGQTGVGKTTFIGQLMEHPRYRRMLYIDADKSVATIAHMVDQDELCVYRRPEKSQSGLHLYAWTAKQLKDAHKVEGVGCIVIEGLAKIYEKMVSDNMLALDPDKCQGFHLQRCYIAPSQLTATLGEAIASLRDRLVDAGRSCPVIVTCNTKNKRNDEEGTEWQEPALSANVTDKLKGRCDAFVEITRASASSGIKILTDRDRQVTARKFRHKGAADAVAKLKNPGLADMLQTWATARAEFTQHVTNHLQQENTN